MKFVKFIVMVDVEQTGGLDALGLNEIQNRVRKKDPPLF